MGYDPNVDYQAYIDSAVERGDYIDAARYEEKRNEKIEAEGLDYEQTHLYENYLQGDGEDDGGTSNSNTSSDRTSLINDMYDDYTAAQIAALTGAYDSSLSELNAEADKIPATYQAQRNTTAANTAQSQASWNEFANASGLNIGATGQAALSRNNNYQGAMTSINTSEADALSAIDLERSQLYSEYQSAIAEATAEGNYQKAQALLENYQYQDSYYLDQQNLILSQNEFALTQQQYTDSLSQYEDRQTQSVTETTAKTGWKLISAGVMPSEEQLAAMGIDSTQAQAYIDAAKSGGSSLTLSQAKSLAADGVFTDAVLSVLYDNGYTDDILSDKYGYDNGITVSTQYGFTGDASDTGASMVYNDALYMKQMRGASNETLASYLASMVSSGNITIDEAEVIAGQLGISF